MVLFHEYWETFKNNYLEKRLQTSASVRLAPKSNNFFYQFQGLSTNFASHIMHREFHQIN